METQNLFQIHAVSPLPQRRPSFSEMLYRLHPWHRFCVCWCLSLSEMEVTGVLDVDHFGRLINHIVNILYFDAHFHYWRICGERGREDSICFLVLSKVPDTNIMLITCTRIYASIHTHVHEDLVTQHRNSVVHFVSSLLANTSWVWGGGGGGFGGRNRSPCGPI